MGIGQGKSPSTINLKNLSQKSKDAKKNKDSRFKWNKSLFRKESQRTTLEGRNKIAQFGKN